MILVIWFVVFEISEDSAQIHVAVTRGCVADIHDDSDNLFLIVLNCKDYTSYIKHYNILTKKWLYMISIWLSVHIIFQTVLLHKLFISMSIYITHVFVCYYRVVL